jgi:NRAMP (natural resistance-associated macrophage protein)-like metal ion transporter
LAKINIQMAMIFCYCREDALWSLYLMEKPRFKFLAWLLILGPGLLVMLADTDAGSLIISAQSGALWGYKFLFQQLLLIPILYIAQELAVRLGLGTGMGHGELIKSHFGRGWALLSVGTLVICCVGALLTEFTGLAAVGSLFGIPVWESMVIVVGFLVIIAWTGSYTSVERVAIFLGLFELVFVWVAWQAKPSLHDLATGFYNIPWKDSSYLYLSAGNIGAVIMPWMIFFQQSAVLDKKLSIEHLKAARWDTAIGAVITQIIMIAVMVITAATLGKTNPNTPLNTVGEISQALTPILGATTGRILFALGMAGSALVATIVVSLTAAWGVGEVLGFRRSLEDQPREAPWFYGIYTLVLILGAVLVASDAVNLVNLSIGVEVMNALLLPIVLGFLYLLARRTLPEKYRLQGWYAVVVAVILLVTSGFGLIAGIWGIVQH